MIKKSVHETSTANIMELEADLPQLMTEWEDMFDAITDWVSIIDLDFRILRTNRQVETLLGIPKVAAIGRKCHELVHGTGQHIPECPIPGMVAKMNRTHVEIVLPDGRWFQVTADPLLDKGGGLRGAVHIVRDITQRKREEAEREKLIKKLETALSKVETLSGLLPICANCKKIRDDQGYWRQIEAFIRSHSRAEFSHGICPECAKTLYPGFDL